MIIDSISAISDKRPIMPKTRWKLKTITTKHNHTRGFIIWINQDLFASRGLLHRCSGICYFFERGSLDGQTTRRLLAKLMGAWSCPSPSCYSAIVCRQRRPDRPFLVLHLSLLNAISYEKQPSSHTSQNPSLHRSCPKRTAEELRNGLLPLTFAGIGSQLVNLKK